MYDSYVDTEFSWIGQIPSNWGLTRVGQFFSERNEKVDDVSFPPLSVTMRGVMDQLSDVSKTDDGSNRKLVRKNDFVINSRSDRKGSSGISLRDGSVSLINIVIEPHDIYPDFIEKLFKSYFFKEEYFRNGKGIHWDLWTTRWDQLKNIKIPVPPIEEQQLISRYLDKKTQQIDSLIEKIQKKIELLKEQRTSLINQYVTKGLDPNVEMKDSGIEWIGEIPKHFQRIRLKHLVSTKITDGPHETPEFIDDGIPFLSVEGVVGNKIDFNRIRGHISSDLHELYSRKCKPQKYDVLLVKSGSTTGKSTIVEVDVDFNIWSPLCILRSNRSKIDPFFLFNSVQSRYFTIQVETNWSYGTQPNIGMGVIEELWLVVPPLNKQLEINEYLMKKTKKLDQLIDKHSHQVSLYKEYRQSLISSVVTGKVRVTEDMI